MKHTSRTYRFRTIIFLLMLATFWAIQFQSCTPKKLKKLKTLHSQQRYEEIINSDVECDKVSPECFQINLIKADSYFQLKQFAKAENYIQKTFALMPETISKRDVVTAYTVKGNIYFEKLKAETDFQTKQNLAAQLEQDLEKALETNQQLNDPEQKDINEHRLSLLLAEVLLMKSDLVEADEFGAVVAKLTTLADRLDVLFPGEGYGEYYRSRIQFKELIPRINAFIIRAEGDRDELVNQLIQLLSTANALKTKPIYQGKYQQPIDLFIQNIQGYLQQL